MTRPGFDPICYAVLNSEDGDKILVRGTETVLQDCRTEVESMAGGLVGWDLEMIPPERYGNHRYYGIYRTAAEVVAQCARQQHDEPLRHLPEVSVNLAAQVREFSREIESRRSSSREWVRLAPAERTRYLSLACKVAELFGRPLDEEPLRSGLLVLKHDLAHVTVDGVAVALDYTSTVSPARKIFWMMLNAGKALSAISARRMRVEGGK